MSRPDVKDVRFEPVGGGDRVSGRLILPARASFVYVLAHGAGAGMRHPFLEGIARRLAEGGAGTFRYQFPYMEAGRRRPDSPKLAQATVRAAVEEARSLAGGAPIVAGGKSFGGRMTSSAAAEEPLDGVSGIAFLGFPLHAPGRKDDSRADHLRGVQVPMLFVQGTRDSLADLALMEPVCQRLGTRATLHVVDGGDHSFKVLKRSGRDQEAVYDEIAARVVEWGIKVVGGG